jgi:hypothetical protein
MRPLEPRLASTVFAVLACLFLMIQATDSFGKCVTAPPGSTVTIDVQACIDGRDLLILRGSTLQWQHLDYLPVGQHADCPKKGKAPTIITTTLNGHKDLKKRKWQPQWPNGTDGGAFSADFSRLCPILPIDSQLNVTLTPVSARGSLTISQQPDPANNETTVLDFNDDDISGPAIYDALLTVEVPQQ